MKQEQKYYEKTINELKNTIAKNKSDTNEKEALQAENKCLSANIEAVKKQLDAIKAQKDKDEKEFKEEIKSQITKWLHGVLGSTPTITFSDPAHIGTKIFTGE